MSQPEYQSSAIKFDALFFYLKKRNKQTGTDFLSKSSQWLSSSHLTNESDVRNDGLSCTVVLRSFWPQCRWTIRRILWNVREIPSLWNKQMTCAGAVASRHAQSSFLLWCRLCRVHFHPRGMTRVDVLIATSSHPGTAHPPSVDSIRRRTSENRSHQRPIMKKKEQEWIPLELIFLFSFNFS